MHPVHEKYLADTLLSRIVDYDEKVYWWKLFHKGENTHFFVDPVIEYKNIIRKYNILINDV